jgi:catechol 2,3-dioxygenase-like lactoylglutathione lyase family enzyme
MPVLKADRFAYVRVQVPDLEKAREFYSDFGLIEQELAAGCLYLRGHGAEAPLLIVETGPQKLAGIGFGTSSRADLELLAQRPDASPVRARDEPGGGWITSLKDPDGTQVEVVSGLDNVPIIPVERTAMNSGIDRLRRTGLAVRPPRGPSLVLRLGHLVVRSPNPSALSSWYRDMLGLLVSDEVYDDNRETVFLSFNRLDRGEEFVDHHVFQTMPGNAGCVHHISFEVMDIDDLYIGHEHLRNRGYHHVWGIGRHRQGSQIFDYWTDPFGVMYEHWTDGDLLNIRSSITAATIAESQGPWGPPPPDAFFTQSS